MITVTAGIIRKDNSILIAQRRVGGRLENKWEFPGGKLENDETPEDCLKREIKEELNIEIIVQGLFAESIFKYPDLEVDLLAFNAEYLGGILKLSSHNEVKWVQLSELSNFDFAEADKPIVTKLMET